MSDEQIRDALMRRVSLAQIKAERLPLKASISRLSDALDALTAAPQPPGAPEGGREDRHRFGSPPEPVVNPSVSWCDAYAAWYYQEPA